MDHPVKVLLRNGLPEIGFMVTRHGFIEGGRDYVFVLEDSTGRHAGAFELTLTDVEGLTCTVRPGIATSCLVDDIEPATQFDGAAAPAWDSQALAWTVAYPGISIPDPAAHPWWMQLGRPLHAVAIQTDQVMISMVFSDARLRPTASIETPGLQAFMPLSAPPPPRSP
jgi:hypothetical protein